LANSILIKNAQMMTSSSRRMSGWLLCQGKQIALMGAGDVPDLNADETIDAGGLTLLPGFIDVHVHGGDGHEVMDGKPDALRAVARFYARNGVTSFLATTWTDSREAITAALEVVAELKGPQPDGATVVGVHLEGPYLNVGRRGAQNPVYFRTADREEALAFLDFSDSSAGVEGKSLVHPRMRAARDNGFGGSHRSQLRSDETGRRIGRDSYDSYLQRDDRAGPPRSRNSRRSAYHARDQLRIDCR